MHWKSSVAAWTVTATVMTELLRIIFAKKCVHPQGDTSGFFYKYFQSIYAISIIFGYNFYPFHISGNRFFKILFPIYALTVSIGVSYMVLSYVKYMDRSPYLYTVVEYIITVTLLIFMNTDNRTQFIKRLELIDDNLHIGESYYCRLKKFTQLIVIIIVLTRIFYSITVCNTFKFYCEDSPMIIFFNAFILIAVDANQMPRLIAFAMIKYRMFVLRKNIEDSFQNIGLSVIDPKDNRRKFAEYQELYEKILDSVNIISGQINPFFLLSLICSFPKIMLLLYNLMVLQQRGVPLFHLIMLGMEAVQWSIIPCLPGIVFELTRAQVDKIKICLLKHYKNCKDYVTRTEIKEFLNYIEQRPCRYAVFRLIPVDITLPVGLFHLCTTYLIVMIQFSHLFDKNV